MPRHLHGVLGASAAFMIRARARGADNEEPDASDEATPRAGAALRWPAIASILLALGSFLALVLAFEERSETWIGVAFAAGLLALPLGLWSFALTASGRRPARAQVSAVELIARTGPVGAHRRTSDAARSTTATNTTRQLAILGIGLVILALCATLLLIYAIAVGGPD